MSLPTECIVEDVTKEAGTGFYNPNTGRYVLIKSGTFITPNINNIVKIGSIDWKQSLLPFFAYIDIE